MVQDAEARLAQHLSEDANAAQEWAATRKLARDPRITRIGQLLRRSSLDELPQIWNVLIGQMSFVGPRPVTREELGRYGSSQADYLRVRPGITGLWQVRGRNQLSYSKRVHLDAEYSRRLSLSNDLGIIVATIPAVLKLSGR